MHFAGRGLEADFAGDALYAVLVYLLIAIIAAHARSRAVGALAIGLCAAVEFFQLTGLPQAATAAFPPSALLLGSGFSAVDLLAYALGAGLAASLDIVARTRYEPTDSQRRR